MMVNSVSRKSLRLWLVPLPKLVTICAVGVRGGRSNSDASKNTTRNLVLLYNVKPIQLGYVNFVGNKGGCITSEAIL